MSPVCARKFKTEQQPIRDATRISVQLRHHVGIFGNVLKEKDLKGHPGNIRDLSDSLATHAFVINNLFTSPVEDDSAETKANKHNEDRDHE